jgi:hypothetical protein
MRRLGGNGAAPQVCTHSAAWPIVLIDKTSRQMHARPSSFLMIASSDFAAEG